MGGDAREGFEYLIYIDSKHRPGESFTAASTLEKGDKMASEEIGLPRNPSPTRVDTKVDPEGRWNSI